MYQHVLMLLNGPCPGMWGWEPSLGDLQVGQEGMEKLAGARGCFRPLNNELSTYPQTKTRYSGVSKVNTARH